MERLTDLTVKTFAEVLASEAPAPGGGSAAALFGACGAALGVMTTNLTVGKKKYPELWDHAAEARAQGLPLVTAFLDALEEDTLSFNRLMDAMHLPKDTDEQKAARRAAMQEATKGAVLTPYHTLELCRTTVDLLGSLVGKVNPNCASDLGVGAAAAEAAARGAWLNININLQSIKDEAYVKDSFARAQAIYRDVLEKAQAIFAAIETSCLPDVCNQTEG